MPALGLCALLVLASCRPLFQREVSGAVLAVEGPAEGTFEGKTFRLTTNHWIRPGEKIATAHGSRLDLMILPGILVELAGGSDLEIKDLRLARDGDENIHPMTARDARIRLRRGAVIASVGPAQIRSRLYLETPVGTFIAGPGRILGLEAKEHQTRIMSVRGRTRFEPVNGSASMTIAPGNFVQWLRTVPQPTPHRSPEAQAEVMRIVTVERRLLHLEKEQRSAYLPWQR